MEIGVRDLAVSLDPLEGALPNEVSAVTLRTWVEYETQRAAHAVIAELEASGWTVVADPGRESGIYVYEPDKTIKIPGSVQSIIDTEPSLPSGELAFLDDELRTDEAVLAALYDGFDVGIVIFGASYQAAIDSAPAAARASTVTAAYGNTASDAAQTRAVYREVVAAVRDRYAGTSVEEDAQSLVPLDFYPATLRTEPTSQPLNAV